MNDYNESPPHFVPKWFHFKGPILCVLGAGGGAWGSTNGVQWDLTFIDLRISRMYVLGVQWNLLAIVEPAFIQHDIVQFWNAMNVLHLESLTLGKDVIPKMTKGMNWGRWPIECKDSNGEEMYLWCRERSFQSC